MQVCDPPPSGYKQQDHGCRYMIMVTVQDHGCKIVWEASSVVVIQLAIDNLINISSACFQLG